MGCRDGKTGTWCLLSLVVAAASLDIKIVATAHTESPSVGKVNSKYNVG